MAVINVRWENISNFAADYYKKPEMTCSEGLLFFLHDVNGLLNHVAETPIEKGKAMCLKLKINNIIYEAFMLTPTVTANYLCVPVDEGRL